VNVRFGSVRIFVSPGVGYSEVKSRDQINFSVELDGGPLGAGGAFPGIKRRELPN